MTNNEPIQGPFTKPRSDPRFWMLTLLLGIILAYLLSAHAAKPAYDDTDASQPIRAPQNATSGLTEQGICGLNVVECPDEAKRAITGTVTTYQAVKAQTDATPCIGAMPNVDFCNPPFPIVANNRLPLGSRVRINGTEYTVADRMNPRYGAHVFDILTDGENYRLTNQIIEIL